MFSESEILTYARHYDPAAYASELMGKSHNTVFKIYGSSPFYLRLTSQLHRQKHDLLGELDFIRFLSTSGAKVAVPIPSNDGDFINPYSSGNEHGYITAFEAAEGLDWKTRENDIDKFYDIGKTLGQIHKTSRCYTPADHIRRRQYTENQHLVRAEGIFRQISPRLVKPFLDFLLTVAELPRDALNFGLTHGDFLFSNYNIAADRTVTVFDFDECEYSWFISDIAVCIYYFIIGGAPLMQYEKTTEGIKILTSLMSGYWSEYALPREELRYLELFFTMRDFVLLSSIYDSNGGKLSPWQKDFAEYAYERILNKRSFFDCDIETFIITRNTCSAIESSAGISPGAVIIQ